MPAHEFLNSDIAQVSGYTTVVATVGMSLLDWIGSIPINDGLQFMVSLGGFVFLFYKIKGQRLDNELKKKKLLEDNSVDKETEG